MQMQIDGDKYLSVHRSGATDSCIIGLVSDDKSVLGIMNSIIHTRHHTYVPVSFPQINTFPQR